MVEASRYNVGGNEAASEVLKNRLGIKNKKSLEDTEAVLLSDAYEHFLKELRAEELRFDTDLIFEIHKYFLGPLYAWAGKIRSVEISKNGVLFAKAEYIANAIKNFAKLLKKRLPAKQDSKSVFAEKLAIIHCEFNAIHPFREGNGRTIRLFMDLLSLANGYGLIDFGKAGRKKYIQACIAGMAQDYSKMRTVIYNGIKKAT